MSDTAEIRERMYEHTRRSNIPPERARELAERATRDAFEKKSAPQREKRPKE